MIDFKKYNPGQNIAVKNSKNPSAKILHETDNHIKLSEALNDANKRGETLFINAWYYIQNKETYELLNGANIVCQNGGFVTDYDGIFLRLKEQYNCNSTINLYYKLHDHKSRYFWVQKGDTLPRNKQSVGVEYVNNRKNQVNGLIYGFTKGIHLKGDKNGVVENEFNLHIRNCRYGIFNVSDNRGWSNQNTFRGSIRGDGFVNRADEDRTESAMIWNQGNGQSFLNMNLENAINNYQYAIYDTAHHNDYIRCRFEHSLGAGMVNFTSNYGSPNIISGYGYAPDMLAKLGKFYDPEGKVTKRGLVHKHSTIGTFNGGGSMFLGGAQAARRQEDRPTLTVSNQHHHYNTLLALENQRHKKKVMFYADGEVVLHQGNNNFINLEQYHKRIGIYNLVEYTPGQYYTWGDWFNNKNFAKDLFKATTWEQDQKKIGIKPNSVNPIVLKDGFIYCKGVKDLKELEI